MVRNQEFLNQKSAEYNMKIDQLNLEKVDLETKNEIIGQHTDFIEKLKLEINEKNKIIEELKSVQGAQASVSLLKENHQLKEANESLQNSVNKMKQELEYFKEQQSQTQTGRKKDIPLP